MTDIEFDRVSLAMTLLHHNLLLFIARVSFAVTASILVLLDPPLMDIGVYYSHLNLIPTKTLHQSVHLLSLEA